MTSTTTSSEISKNVFMNVKKMETSAPDGAHTIYIYSVSPSLALILLPNLWRPINSAALT